MFGIGVSAAFLPSGLYETARYLPVMAVCIFGATPLPAKLWKKWKERSYLSPVLEPVAAMAVLALGTAYMTSATYSPFLYFRF